MERYSLKKIFELRYLINTNQTAKPLTLTYEHAMLLGLLNSLPGTK